MGSLEATHLALVREYLTALENGATGEALARFFTPDVVQIEWPNKPNPNGGKSDLATLLARSEIATGLLASQQYRIDTEIAQGATAAVEAEWSAVLAIAVGSLPAGATMKAHFAMFFTFRDGRIASQRNYDCFEPW